MLGFLFMCIPMLVAIFIVLTILFGERTAFRVVAYLVIIHFVVFVATISGIIFSAGYIMDDSYWKGPPAFLPHHWPVFTEWLMANAENFLQIGLGFPFFIIIDFWHGVFYIWWNKFTWGFAFVVGVLSYFIWVNFYQQRFYKWVNEE